jgi:hypothetical protein
VGQQYSRLCPIETTLQDICPLRATCGRNVARRSPGAANNTPFTGLGVLWAVLWQPCSFLAASRLPCAYVPQPWPMNCPTCAGHNTAPEPLPDFEGSQIIGNRNGDHCHTYRTPIGRAIPGMDAATVHAHSITRKNFTCHEKIAKALPAPGPRAAFSTAACIALLCWDNVWNGSPNVLLLGVLKWGPVPGNCGHIFHLPASCLWSLQHPMRVPCLTPTRGLAVCPPPSHGARPRLSPACSSAPFRSTLHHPWLPTRSSSAAATCTPTRRPH